MPKEYINPPKLFQSLQYGFSQIVTSTGGKTVYLSGQVAWDAEQQIVGAGDLKVQTQKSLENIETALQTVGGTRRDVVNLRIYIKHSCMDETHHISVALRDFFPDDAAPTSTWLAVPALANDDFLIEIEAIAVME